jgi:predicted Zn-dependent protease
MRELEYAERHGLNAAQGWLELGNAREALAELARLCPEVQGRAEVLELRWRVDAGLHDWPAALEAAKRLVAVVPGEPTGYINLSYTLHEMKRTAEAWEQLLPAAERFPDMPIVPYNLACYACQLGQTAVAREWLRRAARLLGWERTREMVLQDPDLAPFRGEDQLFSDVAE